MFADGYKLYVSGSARFPQEDETPSASTLPFIRQHLIFRKSNSAANAAWAFEVEGSGVSSGIVIPMQSERYIGLFGAIRLFATDDDLDEEAVDLDTAHDAWRVLAAIESRSLPAPQIFSHSGTAVVFSWDLPRVSRYLTISHGSAAVLDIDRLTKVKCRYPSQTISDFKVLDAIKALGAPHAATNPR